MLMDGLSESYEATRLGSASIHFIAGKPNGSPPPAPSPNRWTHAFDNSSANYCGSLGIATFYLWRCQSSEVFQMMWILRNPWVHDADRPSGLRKDRCCGERWAYSRTGGPRHASEPAKWRLTLLPGVTTTACSPRRIQQLKIFGLSCTPTSS